MGLEIFAAVQASDPNYPGRELLVREAGEFYAAPKVSKDCPGIKQSARRLT